MSTNPQQLGYMYIAKRPCGRVSARAWDEPGYEKDTTKSVAEWAARGDVVERVERFEGDPMPEEICRPGRHEGGGMKERPILFSGPMIRAILDGRKSQTRRIIQLPHQNPLGAWEATQIGGHDGGKLRDNSTFPEQGAIWHTRTGDCICCPFGVPGDRLWVRETWRPGWSYGGEYPTVQYRATETSHIGCKDYPVLDVMSGKLGIADNRPSSILKGGSWRPSIHMPRWASRIRLRITDVRVERLQDICEADARAEGVPDLGHYRCLWEALHPRIGETWGHNPWVWVIEFRRIGTKEAPHG